MTARIAIIILLTQVAAVIRLAAADPDAAREQALLEMDWRLQDGIGTARRPATYPEAVRLTLERGDLLLRDLQASGTPLVVEAKRWQALRDEWQHLSTTGMTGDAAWDDLWRRVHSLRRKIVFSNPLMPSSPMLFVKQVPGIFSHQLTQYYGSCARPGGGVYVLDAPGTSLECRPLVEGWKTTNIAQPMARRSGAFKTLPPGSFQHLELSHDGRRILFAYCQADTVPASRESNLDRFYHLYEMGADGSSPRQLTEGPFDDFAPRYLSNGQILFISTRRGGYHRCGRGPCPTYTLSLANADGSNPHSISFHETHEWDPAILNDGRVIYTRWDYVDRHAVHYQHLWTVRQDGTAVSALYGNNTLNPIGVWEARPVPGSPRIMATAAAHHAMTAGSIILLDIARGRDDLAPIARLTPDVPFPESEAPLASRGNPRAWHAPLGVTQEPPQSPDAERWPGHCYRTPHPLSEKYFLAAYSFERLIGEPDPNPAGMFGLYLVDCFGNKELLHRDPEISSLWPVPWQSRARPPQTVSPMNLASEEEGVFQMQDVYRAWPPLPPGNITRLRIVQVLPKTTWHANEPMVGMANASPGRQVLGTVPVETDGSAHFRAPARAALAFQALNEQGESVQTMRSVTYLQPGETAACIGCHESRQSAPPTSRSVPIAFRRTPSTITPGPDGSNPFSYPRLVQPVLDRLCVRCHSPPEPGGGVVLTGERQGRFTVSYNTLAPRVPFSAWGGKTGDFRAVNSEPMTRPDFFGARASSLMKLLRQGHAKVALTQDDFERLATWMDANALFYGTFDPDGQARQLRGDRIAAPLP